uniref:Galectin n=1 Tax=Meloidogyne javanica TaxID=6303 RepID=A0A915N7D5_MELJA
MNINDEILVLINDNNFKLLKLKIYVTPGFDVIDFKTENNFKLDFFALQNNTIKVVITNPNEESYEYTHYAERDLRNLSAVLYGGDHVLKKVTLLKDGYDSE